MNSSQSLIPQDSFKLIKGKDDFPKQSFNNNSYSEEHNYFGNETRDQHSSSSTISSPTDETSKTFLQLNSPGSELEPIQLNSSVIIQESPNEEGNGKKAFFLLGNSLKRSKVLGSSTSGESEEDESISSGEGMRQDQSPRSDDVDKCGGTMANGNSTSHSPKNANFSSPVLSRAKEENYECLADGSESFFDSANENTSLQYSRDGNEWSNLSAGSTSSLPFRRNSLLRSSLRKSPQNNNNGEGMGLHRRVGSFRNTSGTKRPQMVPPVTSSSALTASQLYRTSSFNSSGRSSAGDAEEMYSDGSLEDEVIDLTQKYHHLEEKFTVLAENQSTVDDRYARAKQENVELSTKLFMLEEQMRDAEQRSEERMREEQRRFKESLARLEREKELQLANYDIRLQSTQKELETAKSEGTRLKSQMDRERSERSHLSEKLNETERELGILRDDNRKLLDEARADRDALTLETIGSQQALIDLKHEFDSLRSLKCQMTKSPSANIPHHRESIDGDMNELYSRLTELEEENKRIKNENRELREANDDLMAQVLSHGLEEGRQLLTMSQINGMENSLAAEFEAMSQDQPPAAAEEESTDSELQQMKSALKEQKEVNDQLKTYIDTILLSIVENYPQLLEVKNKCPSSSQQQQFEF